MSASDVTTMRGGGGAEFAFDFDKSTFWDGDSLANAGPKRLQFHFVKCNLAGAVVNAYGLVTAQTGSFSGCPADWVFEGSLDGIKWIILDSRQDQACTPNGETYQIESGSVNPYLYYRWTVTRDTDGITAVKIYEAMLYFAGETSTLQPQVCDDKGKCCIFKAGECDPFGGFSNRLLLQSSHDYEYSRQVLAWKEGDKSSRIVSVPILNDCMGCSQSRCTSFDVLQDLPYEEFSVHVGLVSDLEMGQVARSPGALFPFRKDAGLLSFNSTATISIVDDDGPGILSVWSTSCSIVSGLEVLPFMTVFGKENGYDATCIILETARTIEFVVTRTGSARGPVSVQYAVDSVSAIPYTDFIPTNGTLSWAHNDSSPKSFEVEIIHTTGHLTGHYSRTIKARLFGNDVMHGGWKNGYQFVEGGAQLRACEKSVTGICIDPEKSAFIATIVDTDAIPGLVQILLADQPRDLQYYVDQANGTVSIYLERVLGSDLAIFANFETVQINDAEARPCNSSNSLGCEYVVATGMVKWEDLESGVKVIYIQLGTSSMRSPFEKFRFRVWGSLNESIPVCGGYGSIDTQRSFEPSLCDDYFESEVTVTVRRSEDSGYLGIISQAPWPFVVSDRLGYAVVSVDRFEGTKGILSVDYTVVGYPDGGTAIRGIHFSPNSGQLTWPDRDGAPKFIQIDINQGSVPTDSSVDLTVRLRFHSSNTDITFAQRTARVVIKSSTFSPLWKLKRISESNIIKGELNQITVELKPNMVMGPSTSIVVSGITGTDTPDNAVIVIKGPAADIFGSFASWSQDSGSLTVVVRPGQSIPIATTSIFTFAVKNAQSSQSVNPMIVASGNVVCARDRADGVPLNCPESVVIPITTMDGVILQSSISTFSALTAESRLCPYEACPHSTFFGALNYITTSFASPVLLPAGTKISLSGLVSSQSMGANISATFVNLSTDVGVGEEKNQSRICSCKVPRCTCEQTFTEVPKVPIVNLRIQLQCNALGFGRQYGDTISVQVGESGSFSNLDPGGNNSGLSPPSSSCVDDCSNVHDLFDPSVKDVSQHVSSTGQLFVSISSSSNIDFCGQGEFLRAVVTVQWQTVSRTLMQVPATWNQNSGVVVLYVPVNHRIDAGQVVSFTFALRNPNVLHAGSTMLLVAQSQSTSDVVGPSSVGGLVMTSNATPEIEWAAIPESSLTKGKSNRIGIGLKFNGPIGGTENGAWFNVSGLITPSKDNLQILVRPCSFCTYAFSQQDDLSNLVGDPRLGRKGTGVWIQAKGELGLWIRGPGPSYLIPGHSLTGMITLANAENPAPSKIGLVVKASTLVVGTDIPGARELQAPQGGASQVLSAPLTATVLTSANIIYVNSSAYLAQDAITLRVDFDYNLDHIDEISVFLPSLTTCETFINGKTETCVQSLVGTARPADSSVISGMQDQAILFNWNESTSTLTLSPNGGRAACREGTFEITIHASDYGCSDFSCKLKLLPDLMSSRLGYSSISTNALRITCLEKDCGSYCTSGSECNPGLKCKNQNDYHELETKETCAVDFGCYCSDPTGDYVAPPSCSNFDVIEEPLCSNSIPVSSGKAEVLPGAAWGRQTADFDTPLNGACSEFDSSFTSPCPGAQLSKGRAWFGVNSHMGSIFMLGGIGRDGFSNHTLFSNNGIDWKSAGTTNKKAGSFGERAFFPSISHDGYLWIFGGRNSTFDSAMNDVWKSEDGKLWCLVSQGAAWPVRFNHAAVSYSGMMWVIGGKTITSGNVADLKDVWKSDDGILWTQVAAILPTFSERSGHTVVVHQEKMWLYGGYGKGSDVWNSHDGAIWLEITATSGWASRGHHSSFAFDGRLWIIGGNNGANAFSDVWSSTNGQYWQLASSNAYWGKRFGSAAIVFGGRMWLMGGSTDRCDSNGILLCSGTTQTLQCQGSMASCSGNDVWMDASRPLNVEFVSISPSSAMRGADNRIEFSARFDTQLEKGAILEIFGIADVTLASDFAVEGINASAVGQHGRYDASIARAKFKLEQPHPKGVLLSFSFSVQNGQSARTSGARELRLEVSHKVEEFTTSRSSSWNSLATGASGGAYSLDTADSIATVPYSGGVMFDVDVKDSIMVNGFRMHLPRSGFKRLINKTDVQIFYKQGSITTDLEKWCLLGSANIHVNVTQSKTLQNPLSWANGRDQVRVSNLVHAQFEWLEPQSNWADNSSVYMSSSLGQIVNITAVLLPRSNGFWHSGSANQGKVGCVHFPLCPESWPYGKNQWLSFDLGSKHILAGFRTTFPSYDRAPAYYFDGVQYMDMSKGLWEQAHFKKFEIQYSSGGLQGPWIASLAGVAEQLPNQQEAQTFLFEPRTARYWRFLMRNSYGFPYLALRSMEFYGIIADCQDKFDKLYIELDQNGTIVEDGVGISSGVHAFRLHTGVGLEFDTGARRGDVLKMNDAIAVKVGSRFEIAPKFVWEGVSPNYGTFPAVDPREVEYLNFADGFSIVARFTVDKFTSDANIFSMGDLCAGGLSLHIRDGNVKFRQGCIGGAVDHAEDTGFDLPADSLSYCYAVTYRNGILTTYAEANTSAAFKFEYDHSPLYFHSESSVLESIPSFDQIVIGAPANVTNGTMGSVMKAFPGAVFRMGMYEGVLDRAQLSKACGIEVCTAKRSDGRCYTPAPISSSPVQEIPKSSALGSHGATDIDYVKLPARSCFSKYRLRVLKSAGMAEGAANRWCIQELSLFYDSAQHGSTIQIKQSAAFRTIHGTCSTGRQSSCSESTTQLAQPPFAFDGHQADGGVTYCNYLATNSMPSHVTVSFEPPAPQLKQPQCINGYRIEATNSTGNVPTAWYFEGSNDTAWTTLDSQFGITWKPLEWKTFHTNMRPFLLVTSPYHTTWLLKWVGDKFGTDELGWETKGSNDAANYHQSLSSMGASEANIFLDNADYFLEFLLPNGTRTSVLKWDPASSNFRLVWAKSDKVVKSELQIELLSNTSNTSNTSMLHGKCNPSGMAPMPEDRTPANVIPALYSSGESESALHASGLLTCSQNATLEAQPALPNNVMMSEYASETFTIDKMSFVVVSRYNETRSCSFLFKHETTYVLQQTFATSGAVDWTHFFIAGENYLVVANFYDVGLKSHTALSTIYKWDSTSAEFVKWQSILTQRARAWKYFENDGQYYLFLSNVADTASSKFSSEAWIYRFNGGIFEYHGVLPTDGAVAAELFVMNGYTYLALSNMEKLAQATSASTVKTAIYLWQHAAKWVGGLTFTSVYTPSAFFVQRSISDTNNVSEEPNVFTVKLQPDRSLPAGTMITISGLVGSKSFLPTLALQGASAGVFGNIAQWDAVIGRLTLMAHSKVPTELISFGFELQNGIELQGTIRPIINATGAVRIPRASMNGNVMGVLSHPAPGFKTVIAAESSKVQSSLFNNITLTIRSTVHIPSTMVINVTNLNAHSKDGPMEITGRDSNSIKSTVFLYAATGNWSQDQMSLVFDLSGDGIPAFTDFSFAFLLRNNDAAQAPVFPVVHVQLRNGTAYIPAGASTRSILSCSQTPAFVLAELSDSNKVLGAANNITVRLQPNLGLLGGTRITIVGLEGSATMDGLIKIWSKDRLFVDGRGSFAARDRGKMVVETLPKCKALCPDGHCLEHGNDCRFPFSYKGVVHYSCISLDGLDFPICSTVKTFDEEGEVTYRISTPTSNASGTNATQTNAGGSFTKIPIYPARRVMGWANTTGWGYCPFICGPVVPVNEVTEFKFQLTSATTPQTASLQEISLVDDANSIRFMQEMISKNGILNPRQGAQSLFLPPGFHVKTYSPLVYQSLSEFTVELWLKSDGGLRAPHALVQVGDFMLNVTAKSQILLGLPPLTLGGSSSNHRFSQTVINGSWHHISVSWSNATGNLTLYYSGVRNDTISNVHGALRLNSPLILGSTKSTVAVRVTQVRLWKSAYVQAYYKYMIDPASNMSGGSLLAYYPFSGASTFLGPGESTFTTAGSDRSSNQNDLNLGSALIETIPMNQLFLDVYQL